MLIRYLVIPYLIMFCAKCGTLMVDESIKVKPKAIWMQLGVINEEAGKKASNSGMTVVMDKCIMVEHRKLKL